MFGAVVLIGIESKLSEARGMVKWRGLRKQLENRAVMRSRPMTASSKQMDRASVSTEAQPRPPVCCRHN